MEYTVSARTIDQEESFWRAHYRTRPYVTYGAKVDDYMPAYRYGIDASIQFPDRSFADVEAALDKNWYRARGKSSLKWAKAKLAAQDSWDRMTQIATAAKAAAEAAGESDPPK
jgi:hypothetical protein